MYTAVNTYLLHLLTKNKQNAANKVTATLIYYIKKTNVILNACLLFQKAAQTFNIIYSLRVCNNINNKR
jgi:hypothetical protein